MPNWSCGPFSSLCFGAFKNILFIIKVRILFPNKLINLGTLVNLSMINIPWACSPISLEHVFFWCHFLDSHQITNHSNISVQLRNVTKICPLTLVDHQYKLWPYVIHLIHIQKTCFIWNFFSIQFRTFIWHSHFYENASLTTNLPYKCFSLHLQFS